MAVALLAAALALVTSCSSGPPPAVSGSPAAAPAHPVTGQLGNGTTWVAEYPKAWNGTLLLYSHGYGALTPGLAPEPATGTALLAAGFALAGSSYDPHGSAWALNTAVSDQLGALAAVESTVLPRKPAHVLAYGASMGGLVSALEAQDRQGRVDGALTTCGVVAGGIGLSQAQLYSAYAIARLLGHPGTRLTGLDVSSLTATPAALTADAKRAQRTTAGRARLALAMAFMSLPAWSGASPAPVPADDPSGQEAIQYEYLAGGTGFNTLAFMTGLRASLEQAAGGQVAWTAGTDFAAVLSASPYRGEVQALYRTAGLNLTADLAMLTSHASTKADPAALARLRATSQPTGHLQVPELDLHTIADNLVPVQQENYYAALVDRAGSGALLRQAYTSGVGHCNFSASEQVAAVQALLHRVTTGQWGDAATPQALQRAATALHLDPARFTAYSPAPLPGAPPGE
jgi:alpha-beta hydrolase superfamily lysophospholipase